MTASFRAAAPEADYMHALVLDYLRCSGRASAATSFEKEADFHNTSRVDRLSERGRIRDLILNGEIVEAVSLLNDLFPELLENNKELFFKIRLYAFVELLRKPSYDVDKVLHFAQEEFHPCPEVLYSELEDVMALLAFDNPLQSSLKQTFEGRAELARITNDAVLEINKLEEPNLVEILAATLWYKERSRAVDGKVELKKEELEKMFAEYFQ